jgi:hypothetical protein
MSIVEQQKEAAANRCMTVRSGKPCPMVSMGTSVDSCSCAIGETPDSCVEVLDLDRLAKWYEHTEIVFIKEQKQ